MENTLAKEIAETINIQLGGNKFKVMTSAKNFSYDKTGALSFKIGRNASSFNFVKIELNGLDLYNVTFYRITIKGITKQMTVSNVYCDQLRATFEKETGLATSL